MVNVGHLWTIDIVDNVLLTIRPIMVNAIVLLIGLLAHGHYPATYDPDIYYIISLALSGQLRTIIKFYNCLVLLGQQRSIEIVH